VISVTKPPDCSLLTTFPPGFASHHAFQVSREQKHGNIPPHLTSRTLEVPVAGDRYGHWCLAGHGRGEARSASPQNQIGHTADNRSYQGAAGKSRRDQCDPARYMLEIEPGHELEKALDRCACRLHPRRLHDAAGHSSRRHVSPRGQGTTRPKLCERYAPSSIRGRCLGSSFVT
jgi:hypothetical protein